jgi:hypothetical protein
LLLREPVRREVVKSTKTKLLNEIDIVIRRVVTIVLVFVALFEKYFNLNSQLVMKLTINK